MIMLSGGIIGDMIESIHHRYSRVGRRSILIYPAGARNPKPVRDAKRNMDCFTCSTAERRPAVPSS